MKKNILLIILILLITISTTAQHSNNKDIWVTAYLPFWEMYMGPWPNPANYGQLPVQNIDWNAMTHIIVGFLNPDANGNLVADYNDMWQRRRPFNELAHQHGKPVILALGGWGTQDVFRSACSTPEKRLTFVRNLLTEIDTSKYDGVDLDIEPFSNSDTATVGPWIRMLYDSLQVRRQFADPTKKPLLTAAILPGWAGEWFAKHEWMFDQINIMTYDMATSLGWGNTRTWHNNAVFCPQPPTGTNTYYTSIQTRWNQQLAKSAAANGGVPNRRKYGIGIDFNGVLYRGGVYTTGTGVYAPKQIWQTSPTITVDYDFDQMYIQYLDTATTWSKRYDEEAQAAYLSIHIPDGNASNEAMVSYTDSTQIARIIKFVRDSTIGGVILWNIGEAYLPATVNGKPVPRRDMMLQIVKNVVAQTNSIQNQDTLKPNVSFIQPLNGDTLFGIITIKINATDNIGIQKVELYFNRNQIQIDSIAPYEFSFSLENYAGNHTIGAKAYDWNGNSSYFEINVYIIGKPNPPILLLPANNDTNVCINPTLSWSQSQWATNYILELSNKMDFSSIIVNKFTSSTSEIISGLSYNTYYYWRVKAINKAYSSTYSQVYTFKTTPSQQFYRINKKFVDFGKVFINDIKSDSIKIENISNDTVTVNILPPNIQQFYINKTQLKIKPNSSEKLLISFSPTNRELYTSKFQLIIQNEAIIETVIVTGKGIRPPKKVFSTQKVFVSGNLTTGVKDSFYVKNDGDTTLIINNIQSLENYIKIWPENIWVNQQDSQFIKFHIKLDSSKTTDYKSVNYIIFSDNTKDSPDTIEIIINKSSYVDGNNDEPEKYSILQNYPNPFNSETIIVFALRERSFVVLKVYDILGREISILTDGVLEPGKKFIKFNATNLSSGFYYYRLFIDGKLIKSNKMLLLK